MHDYLAGTTADRRRAGGLAAQRWDFAIRAGPGVRLEGTRCTLAVAAGASGVLQLAAAADWPLFGTGLVRVVPKLTFTALQSGEGLRLQSFALLRHRISQGQWRTLVKGVPEAMPNFVNSSPGSFKQKGLWERYGGVESSNRMGFYISVVEWRSTSKVPRLMD